jgi:hypothetical protein
MIARALALVLALGLSGCVSSSPPPSSWCVPRIIVEPAIVAPGESITLSSDTECDVSQPPGGWDVIVAPIGQVENGVSTTVTDDFDGSFSVTVVIPEDFPSGDAFADIANWDYSPCDDTGVTSASSGSCASASGSFTVR